MAPVPVEWQASLGGDIISGNSPRSNMPCNPNGHSLFVFNGAAALMPNTTFIDTIGLVYYEDGDFASIGAWESNDPGQVIAGSAVPVVSVVDPWGRGTFTVPFVDPSVTISGVLFADSTRSVLFFGNKGLGAVCYGVGTANRSMAGLPSYIRQPCGLQSSTSDSVSRAVLVMQSSSSEIDRAAKQVYCRHFGTS